MRRIMREKYTLEQNATEQLDDKRHIALIEFIRKENYTANEVRQAYEQLSGVQAEDPSDKNSAALLAEMRSLTRASFPLNRFVEIIKELEEYEDAPKEYRAFIESLNLIDQQKTALIRAVEDRKDGEIVINLGEGDIRNFPIYGQHHSRSKEDIALDLLSILREILGNPPTHQPINIIFHAN